MEVYPNTTIRELTPDELALLLSQRITLSSHNPLLPFNRRNPQPRSTATSPPTQSDELALKSADHLWQKKLQMKPIHAQNPTKPVNLTKGTTGSLRLKKRILFPDASTVAKVPTLQPELAERPP
jgi:hypothetical protein